MIRAYARVSTDEQTTDPQRTELERAGADILYEDIASGASRRRPELARLLVELRAGDTLLIVRLDRLARSLSHLLEIVDTVEGKGAHFRSLADSFDTSTAQGRMFMSFLGTIAEFERSLIAERTKAGLASARAKGRIGGNPRLKDPDDAAARRQISIKRRSQYLDALRANHPRWLPTVETLRPHLPWGVVVRRLRQVDPGAKWTKPKLVRAVRGLDTLGIADGQALLAPAKPLGPDDVLPRIVASIARGKPDLSIRGIATELEALGERTPRGGRTWSVSSTALQLGRARDMGLLPTSAP